MNVRRFLVTGLLVIGLSAALTRAQEPPRDGDKHQEKEQGEDRAVAAARLRARLELAELNHDVAAEVLKESLLLLRRAERSRLVEGSREGEAAARGDEELKRLALYVESQTEAYSAQVVAIDRLRHELMQLQPAPRIPLPGASLDVPGTPVAPDEMPGLQPGAVVGISPAQMVPGRLMVSRPGAAGPHPVVIEPGPRVPEEQLDQADEAEQEVLLLQVRLQAYRQALDEARQQLANLEVEASKPEKRGDKALQKSIESAREHFRQARKDRFDLAQRLAREQERLDQLRAIVGPGPGEGNP
jgi:hypothetical protein